MKTDLAIEALAALAHEKRLAAFRLLVTSGSAGVASGALAEQLGLLPSTMSINLNRLAKAGLVRSARQGKEVRYFAELEQARALIQFLMQDCCAGRPEVCGPWMAELMVEEDQQIQMEKAATHN